MIALSRHTFTVSQPVSRKIALLSAAAVLLTAAVAWVWPGDNTAFFSSPAKTAPTNTPEPPFQGWWDARRQGEPYGTQVQGIITFRGNPTRTFYGTGPIPRTAPQELWRFPKSGGLARSPSTSRVHANGAAPASPASPPSSSVTGKHLDGRRRLRQGPALPRRQDRRAPHRQLPHRRHHQGHRDHRPRRVPAGLHRIARQLLPGRRLRSRQAAQGAVEDLRRRRLADHVERRLGRLRR